MAREVTKSLKQVEKDLEQTTEVEAKPQREFLIEMEPNGLYAVRMSGGGRIPDLLSGRFTNKSKVEELITIYENTKGK